MLFLKQVTNIHIGLFLLCSGYQKTSESVCSSTFSERHLTQANSLFALGSPVEYCWAQLKNRHNLRHHASETEWTKSPGTLLHCGEFGHLAASCPLKGKQYPFGQPVVAIAEVTGVLSESSELSMCFKLLIMNHVCQYNIYSVNDSESVVDVWDTYEVTDTCPNVYLSVCLSTSTLRSCSSAGVSDLSCFPTFFL